MLYLQIIILLTSFLIFFASKKIFNLSFSSPPVLVMAYWWIFVFAGFVAFPDYEWNFYSTLWIFASVIFFTVGYILTMHFKRKSKEIHSSSNTTLFDEILTRRAVLILLVIGVIYFMLKIMSYGLTLGSILNFNELIQINNRIAIMRYTGNTPYSLIDQFFLIFVYTAPLVGGFLYLHSNTRNTKIFCVLTLFPEILVFSITNEKAGLLITCIFWISAYITSYLTKYRKLPTLKTKNLLLVTIIILLLLSFFIISMMLRIGSFDSHTFSIVLGKIGRSYAFAHMPAFDSVFSKIGSESNLAIGRYTFYGLFDFFGLAHRNQGVYTDFFRLQSTSSNVYTAFRGLISDFGYLGALVIQFLVGAFTAFCVSAIVNYKYLPLIAVSVLVIVYSFILYSFIVSIFTYMSITASLILFVFVVRYLYRASYKKICSDNGYKI